MLVTHINTKTNNTLYDNLSDTYNNKLSTTSSSFCSFRLLCNCFATAECSSNAGGLCNQFITRCCNHTEFAINPSCKCHQQQSQPILQHGIHDDDKGGVSNALSHGNSKSLAANVFLHCLELCSPLCSWIKSALPCARSWTSTNRAASQSKITRCIANRTWVDSICAHPREDRPKILCMFTVDQLPFSPKNVSNEYDVWPPYVVDGPL